MSCCRIQLLDLPNTLPEWVKDDNGMVYLTMGEDVQIELYNQLEEQTILNEITVEAAIGFNLEADKRNQAIFDSFFEPNALNPTFAPLLVYLWVGGRPHTSTSLHVLAKTGKASYSVELRAGNEHWVKKLKEIYVRDLPFDDFEVSTANMNLNWSLESKYDPDNAGKGYWFPMVDYGNWVYKDYFGVADFRPWLHIRAILEKSFCAAGFVLDDSILKTDFGSRLITYLLSSDYGRDTFEGENEAFNVSVKNGWYDLISPNYQRRQSILGKNHIIKWNDIVYNPGNYYGGAFSGHYGGFQAIGMYQFFVKWDIFLVAQLGEENFSIELIVERQGGKVEILDSQRVVSEDGGLTHKFLLVSDEVLMKPGDTVYVRTSTHGETAPEEYFVYIVDESSYFKGRRVGSFFDLGDTIEFKKEIDPEITAYDVLAGYVHLIKGLFYTNWQTRTVSIRPPFSIPEFFENEAVEGFYTETQVQAYDKLIECDSVNVTTPALENLNRNYRVMFKRSSDALIEEENLDPDDSPLYSRSADLEVGRTEDMEENENPLFEPTINRLSLNAPNRNFEPEIPHLWDNTKNEISYKIKPRILYAAGWRTVTIEYPGGELEAPDFLYFGEDNTEVGLVYQRYPLSFQITNTRKTGPGNPRYRENLTFDAPNDSLWAWFYDRWINETYFTHRLSLLAHITMDRFHKLNYRDYLSVEIQNRIVYARLLSIEGFDPCGRQTTELMLAPLLQSSKCLVPGNTTLNESAAGGGSGEDGISGRPPGCPGNNPELLIEEIAGCYDFSLDGDNQSTVENVVFEYRYMGTDVWVPTAQLCNPTGAFEVRMVVFYEDDCPQQVRKDYVDPCSNRPEPVIDYNHITGCFTITIGGESVSTIDEANTNIYYRLDGGPWILYAGEICDATADLICSYAVVEYTGSCPAVTTEERCIQVENDPDRCEDIENAAGIECVTGPDGGITISRTGNINPDIIAVDNIKYRPVGETEWRLYEGQILYDCPVEAHRVIILCDGDCPPICTEIIECTCTGEPPCGIQVVLNRTGPETLYATVTGATNVSYEWYERPSTGGAWTEIVGETDPELTGAEGGKEYKVIASDDDKQDCNDQDEILIPESCIAPEITIITETNDNGVITIVFEVTTITGAGDITATANTNPLSITTEPEPNRYSITYTAGGGETSVDIVIDATNDCDTVTYTKTFPICYDPTVTLNATEYSGCGEYDIIIDTTNIDNVNEINATVGGTDFGGTINDNGSGNYTLLGVQAGNGTGQTEVIITVDNGCTTDTLTVNLDQCNPPVITETNAYIDGDTYVVEFSTQNVLSVNDLTGLANGVSPTSLTWDGGTETGTMVFDLEIGSNPWSVTATTCCGSTEISGTIEWDGCPPEGEQQNTLSC